MFKHPKPQSSIEKTRLRSNASVHLRMTVKAFLGAADLMMSQSAFRFLSGRQQNKKMV
jgi:hypothetical protein